MLFFSSPSALLNSAAASAMVLSTTIPEMSCLQNALLTPAVSSPFTSNGCRLRLLLRPLIDDIILISTFSRSCSALALLFSRDHNTSEYNYTIATLSLSLLLSSKVFLPLFGKEMEEDPIPYLFTSLRSLSVHLRSPLFCQILSKGNFVDGCK